MKKAERIVRDGLAEALRSTKHYTPRKMNTNESESSKNEKLNKIKRIKILFILFSPILFLCFLQFYVTFITMFFGGPLGELFNIETDLLFRIEYGISGILSVPSVIGVWKQYRERTLKSLDPTAPFMM